ncbi:hypothetical protein K474DRAFT_1263602 [Panus rudis PR-1116 ss-1]|nr:hypothetical protein K474DRAFT_1263602 [Panus rudis PR-1116 ss-1]
MACAPTPTETQYATIVTPSIVQTVSDSIVTIPPSVTTLGQGCPSQADDEQGCSSVVSTIDGGETTVQVPVAITVQVTSTIPALTLFAPCDASPPPPPPPSSPQPPPSVSSSSSPPSSSSQPYSYPPSLTLITTTVTPAPDIYFSQSLTTLADGSVYLTAITITHTHEPTAVIVPSPSSFPTHPNGNSGSDDGGGGGKKFTGPIVGGVLGGFFGFIALVCLGAVVWKTRDRIFRSHSPINMDMDMDFYSPPNTPPIKPTPEPEPKPQPYHYGLVGRASSHPSRGASPPPPNSAGLPPSASSVSGGRVGVGSGLVDTEHTLLGPGAGKNSTSNSRLSLPLQTPSPSQSQKESESTYARNVWVCVCVWLWKWVWVWTFEEWDCRVYDAFIGFSFG